MSMGGVILHFFDSNVKCFVGLDGSSQTLEPNSSLLSVRCSDFYLLGFSLHVNMRQDTVRQRILQPERCNDIRQGSCNPCHRRGFA